MLIFNNLLQMSVLMYAWYSSFRVGVGLFGFGFLVLFPQVKLPHALQKELKLVTFVSDTRLWGHGCFY